MSSDPTLLVVGGGPAGVTAALQACELGAQVTLLEAGQIGGTSLNRGPAPVRTLARTARYAHDKKDLAGHLRRHGIDLVENLGPVGFADPHTLAADEARRWSADRIILAVGGHAGRLRIPGADLALTYEDIPSLASFPRRVAVVGGADTGCQIASIFDDLGAAVSLFEAGPVLIPTADAIVSAELSRAFRAQDMSVHTDTLVEALGPDSGAIRVDYRSGSVSAYLIADVVFFAVGWPANLGHLALTAAEVHATPAAIGVDDYLRTNVEHIFVPHLYRGRLHGRTEDLPDPRHRELPPGVELSRA